MIVAKPKTLKLPTIEENPQADVVIYDGHCRFCTSQVRKLARWDRRRRLAFLSLHDDRVVQRWPDLTHEQLMKQMYLITSDGRRFAGAAAFRFLTRRLPRLWLLAPLMHIPLSLPLWQFIYGQVAKRRYFAGKTEECGGEMCKVHFQ